MNRERLMAGADAAAAAGDVLTAIAALRELASGESDDFAVWMKLAAMCRAAGKPDEAIDAVHRALAVSPLDFMALLLRASLLDRMGDDSAGEAYGRALVQLPGNPDPALSAIIARARQQADANIVAREAALAGAMAAIEAAADPAVASRLARFRSNAVRRTRHYASDPTHFHYPGLTEREFHERSLFPWLDALEAATGVIRQELVTLLNSQRAELVPYIRYADHEPLDQWRDLNNSSDWSAIHLLQNGERVEANARHCPATFALLATLPQPQIAGCSPNAMFSLLAPGAVIPPHTGVTNTRLVCHLPLIIPPSCWFRVGAETRPWQEGHAFIFDDSIEHEAANPSDLMRAVFIFDIWHPGLNVVERQGVTALLATAAGGPSLGL